jgi:preprotein translocase subunit SecD
MARRENYLFLFVILILVFAMLIVFPVSKGLIGNKDFQYGLDISGGSRLTYQVDLANKQDVAMTDAQVMTAVQQKITQRVNAYGVTEVTVKQLGSNRVLVELPGVTDATQAVASIGQNGLLEFKVQSYDASGNLQKDANGNIVWVAATALGSDGVTQEALTGSLLKPNTYLTTDSLGKPEVAFEWNTEGAKLFGEITTSLYNNGVNSKVLGIFLDGTLVSDPQVDAVITDKGIIQGVTIDQAKKLVAQLNSGTLNVPLTLIANSQVDATLGKDSVTKSYWAGLIGIACVALFMIVYYRLLGLVATVALGIYALIILAVFKIFNFTLSVPGIAGFVISTGMAVDANVLIFERMKEELKRGLTIKMAVAEGFHRAWPSIWISNVSTIITCFILIWFGNTVVKGFGLNLLVGVVVSMFSAVMITRTFLTLMVNNGMMKSLSLYGVKHD